MISHYLQQLNPTVLKPLVWHPSVVQDSADVKDDSSGIQFHDSSWSNSKQSADTNVDEASNKKLKSGMEWNTYIKNSPEQFLRKAPITATHQRHKDYEISDIKEDPFFKRNAATYYEKSKLEKDRPSSIINSYPEKSISQQFKDSHIFKNKSVYKNFTKFSENNNKNINHINGSKKSPMKKYSKQFNSSRDKKKENSNDSNKEDEEKTANSLMKSKKNDNVNSHSEESISQQSKTHVPKRLTDKNLEKFSRNSKNLNHKTDSKLSVTEYLRQSGPSQSGNEENNENGKKDNEKTVKPLMWKSKEEKNDAGRKDTTEKLNHERSFHSGRWGMSVSSPPTEFLKDISRRSNHRKNKEQTEKDGKHSFGLRWDMSVALPPKEFLEDISMHRGHGTEHFAMKTDSRPNEVKGFYNDRQWPPIHHRRNLQTALFQQLMTNERYKKLVGTLLGKVPNGLYDSRYPSPNYWNNYPTNTDLNNGLFLRLLQALWSHVWQDDVNIPMSCRIQIPYTSSRI